MSSPNYPACMVRDGDSLHCTKHGFTVPYRGERVTCNVCAVRSQEPPPPTPPPERPRDPARGPGDYLHDMIKRWAREEPTQTCGCAAMIRQMNAWGPAGCRQHAEEIVAHMIAEAKARSWKILKVPGGEASAKALARLAIKRACRLAERARK